MKLAADYYASLAAMAVSIVYTLVFKSKLLQEKKRAMISLKLAIDYYASPVAMAIYFTLKKTHYEKRNGKMCRNESTLNAKEELLESGG